ncbi:MAG: DNA repair protein RecN [Alphaproteobacteria bacterium]|nr:DNA repair protein RecN [Alphaproteobacteria bacterium]MCB1551203.1 DNA repair protein RecN [Alphaproteobacteria bacterium]MCB9985225.1 DNA repair protein RecN [Micavibrio sp.]HRK98112.1 DNA repair protein RecN [Alphaproteobacteria bacterium]
MLHALHIKNVVLIEQLSLDFSTGLSALTGETGAGKSILLDSLGLALGSRAEASLVRRGADQASVTVEFSIESEHPVWDVLKEQGIDCDGALILRRVLGSDGRSRAFVNDESVSVGFLKSLGETLVDIHGQFETYGLLNPSTHRSVLDCYAGNSSFVSDVSDCFRKWRDAEARLVDARALVDRAMENEVYLRDCVEELKTLSPEEGEELSLVDKKKRIQHVDALRECFSFVGESLGGEQGADIQIGQAWRMLERNLDKIGMDISDLLGDLGAASDSIQQACRKLDHLVSTLDIGDLNAEDIEDRLYSLRAVARKHHCAVDDLPRLLDEMSGKLDMLDHQGDVIQKLEREVQEFKEKYRGCAEILHEKRQKAAQQLDKIINSELKPLKLDKSVFETSIEIFASERSWGAQGFDDVRFLVATNASSEGAPDFGALNKIASGGEMARFMLALKVVLADSALHTGVFVFDEIDTGIGGATASAVGERLAKLALRHQVMVVTHSPQVAAQASHHWVVSKAEGVTHVVPLSGGARQEEIARMLAGAEVTVEARAAASRLLNVG